MPHILPHFPRIVKCFCQSYGILLHHNLFLLNNILYEFLHLQHIYRMNLVIDNLHHNLKFESLYLVHLNLLYNIHLHHLSLNPQIG